MSASSLYEAAVLGLKAFRESDLVEGSLPGPATTLTITVRRESESHEAKVSQVEAWLSGQGKTPRKQALKVRLREMVEPANRRERPLSTIGKASPVAFKASSEKGRAHRLPCHP